MERPRAHFLESAPERSCTPEWDWAGFPIVHMLAGAGAG
jgi:hypothetical protein